MGAVRFSIDPGLVRTLCEALPLKVFVETGTYEGASVRAVAPMFEEVHTIEAAPDLYARAVDALRELNGTRVYHGRSEELLPQVASSIRRKSVLYWLDAHWCATNGASATESGSPLLGELEAIKSLNARSVVMIDDARLYLTPPPEDSAQGNWPEFDEILEGLSKLSSEHQLLLLDDVLVFYPAAAKEAIRSYARDHGVDLLEQLDKARMMAHHAQTVAKRLDQLVTQISAFRDESAESDRRRVKRSDRRLQDIAAQIEEVKKALASDDLEELRSDLRAVGTTLEQLEESFGEVKTEAGGARTAIAALPLDEVREQVGNLGTRLNALSEGVGNSAAELERLRADWATSRKSQSGEIAKVSEAVSALSGRLSEPTETLLEVGDGVKAIFERLETSDGASRSQIAQVGEAVAGLTEQLGELSTDSRTIQEAISELRLVEAAHDVRLLRGNVETLAEHEAQTHDALGDLRLTVSESNGGLRDALGDLRLTVAESNGGLSSELTRFSRGIDSALVRQEQRIEEIEQRVALLTDPLIEKQERRLARQRRRQTRKAALARPFRATKPARLKMRRARMRVWRFFRRRYHLTRGVMRRAYRRTFRRLHDRIMAPRLGRLEHHHKPKPMKVPRRYHRASISELDAPMISIVTPSYNSGEFLERTIRSVAEQDYPRCEHIVQDGASTDDTVKVLEENSDHLHHFESKPDEGQGHAINLGFAHSSGDVMAYLNADDLLLPGALAYVARYFERHPKVDVVYGHRVLVNEDDKEIGRWVMPRHKSSVLSWADYVPQETLFWRRSTWEASGGGMDESFRFALDWDLILRFRDSGARIVRVPRFLGAFRVHEAQKTSAQADTVGSEEMDLIRAREHGRQVDRRELRKALRGYMRRHVVLQKLYRAHLVRY